MCCCGKPVVNGELGYKWQPSNAPIVRPPDPPELSEGDVLLFDEPGRCGGLDHHCHHFRLIRWHSSLFILVKHGGGQERVRLFPLKGLADILGALDSNARFWMLATIYSAHRKGTSDARDSEAYKWREAAAEKRIKTQKKRGTGFVKVWIEPKEIA